MFEAEEMLVPWSDEEEFSGSTDPFSSMLSILDCDGAIVQLSSYSVKTAAS